MAIGTCTKCGQRVVWDPQEIEAHRQRCAGTRLLRPGICLTCGHTGPHDRQRGFCRTGDCDCDAPTPTPAADESGAGA